MSAVDRPSGPRSRAGNAMGRARAGVLDGALRSVVKQGTRATTMSGIATLGGVAKATVYNHFRTKDEVWAALVADEVDRAVAVTESSDDLPRRARGPRRPPRRAPRTGHAGRARAGGAGPPGRCGA